MGLHFKCCNFCYHHDSNLLLCCQYLFIILYSFVEFKCDNNMQFIIKSNIWGDVYDDELDLDRNGIAFDRLCCPIGKE